MYRIPVSADYTRMEDVEWIRRGLQKPGKTQAGLAKALGRDPSVVSKILTGQRAVKASELQKIQTYLDTPPDASILRRILEVKNNPQFIAAPPGLVTMEPGASLPKTNDLPIRGHVRAGAMGLFLDQGIVGGYAMRPSALEGNLEAYAVRVYDDSMKGKLEAGWILQVDPLRNPRPGDFVVVQTSDGQAFVKRLMRRTDRAVICEQFNPPKQVEYPTRTTKLHLVVGIDLISR